MASLSKDQIKGLLTNQTITRIAPGVSAPIKAVLRDEAPSAFVAARIDTVVRIAHFFAQIMKETGGLKRLDENLRYTTAARIRAVWPSRFPTLASAEPYVAKPEKLANFVYANRNGNGAVASGDGWRYRGSGLIQLTGRGNFRAVGELIGVGDDLVNDPDKVREPAAAVTIAVGYWLAREINSVADGSTGAAVDKVTRRVNPYESADGRADRRANFVHALDVLTAAEEAAGIQALLPAGALLEALEVETATEPDAVDLLADRSEDLGLSAAGLARVGAVPPVYWPSDDRNSPDYYHVAHLHADREAEGNFELTADDLALLAEANAFAIPNGQDIVTIALRGATLGGVHESIKQTSIACMNKRPDHSNFRCVLGFWYRDSGRITLFSGSTVPAPKYMKNYYFKKNGLPHSSSIDCNMLPTGHYVFRVGTHAGGTIRPALRMSRLSDPTEDASVSVWRTFNDLTFGLADVLDPPRPVYDNVHCSYFLNYNSAYEASFSSAGCLTVRGRKDPSDQWEKFQGVLRQIGTGKRTDMILLTGKEASIASQGRAAGRPRAELLAELARLRIGSSGDRVRSLQRRLGLEDDGDFGAGVQARLREWQAEQRAKPDAIYSPMLDDRSGWGIFA